ncbi:MAG: glycosyltransferase family 9 protein [Abditibacteriaceae bacterium]
MSSPVLEALRDRYPDAHISWVVQEKSVSVVQGLPGLDEVILWKKWRGSYWLSLLSYIWRVRRRHFDVALDLQGLDKAALAMIASGAKRRISGSTARPLAHYFCNERVDERESIHARQFYLRRVSTLDIADDSDKRYFPRVPMEKSHIESVQCFMAAAGWQKCHPLFCINLGASFHEKTWPAANYAQIAWRILQEDKDARVLALGASSDEQAWIDFYHELQRLISGQPPSVKQDAMARIISGVGKLSLMELAAAATLCTAFLTTDTGPMHIAASVGAPILAMFGPSHAQFTGPVKTPNGAPIRVVDAKEITGSWPAPLSVIGVDLVWDELQLLISPAKHLNGNNGHVDLPKTLGVEK